MEQLQRIQINVMDTIAYLEK